MAFIVAKYDVYLDWDLDELGINPNDIEKYYIKYGILNIKLKDSDEWLEFELDHDLYEFDFKRAESIEEHF